MVSDNQLFSTPSLSEVDFAPILRAEPRGCPLASESAEIGHRPRSNALLGSVLASHVPDNPPGDSPPLLFGS